MREPISNTTAAAVPRFWRECPSRSPALNPAQSPAQHLLAGVGRQHNLSREHVDELVLLGVPVPLARPGARRQAHQVHSVLRQPRGIAKACALAQSAGLVERWRIKRAYYRFQRRDIDFLEMPVSSSGPLRNPPAAGASGYPRAVDETTKMGSPAGLD